MQHRDNRKLQGTIRAVREEGGGREHYCSRLWWVAVQCGSGVAQLLTRRRTPATAAAFGASFFSGADIARNPANPKLVVEEITLVTWRRPRRELRQLPSVVAGAPGARALGSAPPPPSPSSLPPLPPTPPPPPPPPPRSRKLPCRRHRGRCRLSPRHRPSRSGRRPPASPRTARVGARSTLRRATAATANASVRFARAVACRLH